MKTKIKRIAFGLLLATFLLGVTSGCKNTAASVHHHENQTRKEAA